MMEKVFKSKWFVFLTPAFSLVLFLIAGWLLGYVPKVTGDVWGTQYGSSGYTRTQFVFSMRNAVGIWLIGVAVSLLIFLVCVFIQKLYFLAADKHSEISDNE